MFDRDDRSLVRPRVKICGITTEGDARAAIELGADALGFNFFPGSKRYLPLAGAAGWMAKLPAEIVKVAVLVDADWKEACAIGALPFIDALQLHGSEEPEYCRKLAEKGIQFAKAIPVMAQSLGRTPSFFTKTLVLDSSNAGEFGGSGRTFPWEIARDFAETHPELRVILAGGLTPENVRKAMEVVRPFGVDVTTGVESSPGRKNHALLRAFISVVRSL
jgi:phosphoribosylanthranilate isomerase